MRTLLRIGTIACLIAGVAPGTSTAQAPTRDPKLEAALAGLAAGVQGDVGIYVRHLRSGREAAIRADELFPTASMIKVPILVALFQQITDGKLGFRDTLTWTDSLAYDGEDLLAGLRDSTRVPLSKVVLAMASLSDNSASLWLQHQAGTGTAINAWLATHGFDSTRVNSRTPGREDNRSLCGWGQTTPREMAELLVRIRQERAVSPAADQEMYRILARSYWNGEALSQLPPWVQAAAKNGAVNRSRSEVVLVNAPSGDYVFCVITKNQADETWVPENQGFVLLRRVSALLWQAFEPGHPWQPAEGAGQLKP